MKSSRYRSREFALQGVYQWLLSHNAAREIAQDITQFRGFDKCDALYFRDLLDGVIRDAEAIDLFARGLRIAGMPE